MDLRVISVILLAVIVRVSLLGVSPPNRCPCFSRARMPVDECENSTLNNCDPNATCFDLTVRFACRCNDGFIGNGTFCKGNCAGSPCFGANRECYRNDTCVCSPGFHELNDTCVQDCAVYGDTFIDYPGSGINCPEADLLSISDEASVSDCKAVCLNTTGCISIIYNTLDNGCGAYACDPLFPDAVFVFIGDEAFTAIRNCD